jgi:hypothetical protein
MPVVAGVFGAIFPGPGALALAGGAQRMWRGSTSEHWPSAGGTVLFFRVNSPETRDVDQERKEPFSPQFVSTYEAGGVKHFNNRRRFGRIEDSGQDRAADIAARCKAGKTAAVHYYPADPDIAVLEPGNNPEGLWPPGAGLVALLFGPAALIWMVPAAAKRRAARPIRSGKAPRAESYSGAAPGSRPDRCRRRPTGA